MSDHPDTVQIRLARAPRRFRVGYDCGDVFAEGDDFDGLTLTLELLSEEEAETVARFLRTHLPHWQPSDDTGGYLV